MKKSFLISIGLTILLGAFFGKMLYGKYETETVMVDEDVFYLLQYGVYTNLEEAQKEQKKMNPSLLVQEEEKYYLYLGMSLQEKLLQKVKNDYDKENIVTYIKKTPLWNDTFKNHLSQWDVLLKNANTKEEVHSICEVVLADYEETVLTK